MTFHSSGLIFWPNLLPQVLQPRVSRESPIFVSQVWVSIAGKFPVFFSYTFSADDRWWNLQNSLTIPPPNQQNIYKKVVEFPTSGHLISQWDRGLAACSALGCQLAPANVEKPEAGSSRRELRTWRGRGGRESIQFLGRPHSTQPCDPSDRSTPFCASSYERGAHCSLLLESPST